MKDAFGPVLKQSLSDSLAQRIRGMIQRGDYTQGDRLPPIMEMARRFGVGHPTIREALKKLETMGIVEIRHGSGVYVSRSDDVLVLASPGYSGTVTKKLLLDLIHTRIPLEMHSVSEAIKNATLEDLVELRRTLTTAGQNLANDDVLNEVNMSFHRQIARASKNTVLTQLLRAARSLYRGAAAHPGHLRLARARPSGASGNSRGARAAQREARCRADAQASPGRGRFDRALERRGSSRSGAMTWGGARFRIACRAPIARRARAPLPPPWRAPH